MIAQEFAEVFPDSVSESGECLPDGEAVLQVDTYPAQILKRAEETRVTVFPGVPTIFSMMLAMHARKKLHYPMVTRVTNTAAALPEEYIPKLKEIFPEALIYKMYGLTECKRVCYLEPELVSEKPSSSTALAI